MTTSTTKSIGVGDHVPDVTLPDSAGAPISLSSFRGRWLVVFFYPMAFSPLCVKEACSFRDEHEAFVEAGAAVVGISSDPVDKIASFARTFKLPYTLLSDSGVGVGLSARERFGVPRTLGIFPGRATYVIDRAGVVRAVYVNSVRAKPHTDAALAAIRAG
jgi:peroxiredoxin Q/BCP